MFEKLTTSLALLKPHVIDFILADFANSGDKSFWVVLTNVDFLRQMAFRGENEPSIQKECTRFPISDLLQLLMYFA